MWQSHRPGVTNLPVRSMTSQSSYLASAIGTTAVILSPSVKMTTFSFTVEVVESNILEHLIAFFAMVVYPVLSIYLKQTV